jgi:zinc protease
MTRVDRTRLPQPGPEPAFAFPGPDRCVLDNGLSLWTLQRGTLPLMTVMATIPAGSWYDPPETPGLASMTADMLDEGTAGMSAIEIQEALARLGAELETDAGHDAVTVTLTLLQRHLPEGLRLLANLMCRPTIADAEVERVRTLRLNRLRQLRDHPAALAERAYGDALYGTHPYAHLPFGSSESLQRLVPADVARFHASAYRPNVTTLIVVGPGSSDETRAAVEGAFGAWAPDTALPAGSPGATWPATPSSRLVLIDRPGAAQTELRLGHVAVPRRTPEFHALLVLNTVLGGQFVSRLNLNLREQKGYTYGVRTAFEFRRQPGPFTLGTSVQTDATADAVAESLREIAEIRGPRPVSHEELRLAQQTLTLGYPRGFESTAQIARALSQLVLHQLPDDTFAVFSPRIRAQDADAVTAAARLHLDPDRLAVVAVGDVARIGDSLGRLGLGEPVVVNPAL